MTHAESQDLLLDLAYGELDAVRAAEVEQHLAGCADCQREKAALEQTRSATAGVRELHEPSPGFDEKILAAARAQAQLEHEGNIGQVIEVKGNVRPLGLDPARVDAHGLPPLRQEPPRPRWVKRAALGGSVAAAAALALVVSTSLQSRREAERAARLASDKSFEIHVRAPLPEAANEAYREAKKEEPPQAVAQRAPPAPAAPPPPPAAPRPPTAKKETRRTDRADGAGRFEGSGGDLAQGAAVSRTQRPAEPPAPARAADPEVVARRSAKKAAEAPRSDVTVVVAEPPQPAAGVARSQQVASASSGAAGARPPSPAELEQTAQQARHAGDYLRAAELYRRASALRNAAGERSGEPAWDLAHAVECLAAIGRFDDARTVREELSQRYPSETSAFAAAGRALRAVDAAAPVRPAAESKAKSAEPR